MNRLPTRRDFIKGTGLAAAGALAGGAFGAAAPSGSPLRVVQIGTGSHSAGYWDGMQRMSSLFACAGVFEPDLARREKAQGEPAYRGARWLTEEEVFGGAALDAAVVQDGVSDRVAVVGRCLNAGWHVHSQRAPGDDLASFDAIQALALRKRLVLQLGNMWRYHPAFQLSQKLIRDGTLGEIFSFHGEVGKPESGPPGPMRESKGETKGSRLGLTSYLVDIVVAAMGKPDRVVPFLRRTHPNRGSYNNILAVMEYPGAVATLRSMPEIGGGSRRQFSVFGTKGSYEILPIEPARARLALLHPAPGIKSGSYQPVALRPITGRYDDMLLDFANMAMGHPSQFPEYTPAHDRVVQEIAVGFRAA